MIEEICLHIYKQRKKIASAHDKNSPRSFVSVSHVNLNATHGSRLIFDFPADDCHFHLQVFDPFGLDFERIFSQHSDIG